MAEEVTRTLWVGTALADLGGVDPSHRAILTAGPQIVWTGQPEEAPTRDVTVDLGSAWLTPGFVDAHVHATATGMLELGLDLTAVGSAAELLAHVRRHATARAADATGVIYGAGWDDLTWPDGLPDPGALAEAAGGATVVLVRIDGHSCLVDQSTLARLDLRDVEHFVDRGADGQPTGWLKEDATARAMQALRAATSPAHLARARAAAVDLALRQGVTTIHEMGIPELSDRDDATCWATGTYDITVHTYWADLSLDPEGVLRPGGDLFLDGSIGSCTAATTRPYRTSTGGQTRGVLFHDDDTVAEFFITATHAGRGAGVHAIGDRATAQAVRAISTAADVCGRSAVRAARHRVEHAEMISRGDIDRMADLGVVASLQPAFDAVWNGPGGLYEHRFGRPAADQTNPFEWFDQAGVAMCFSSDSTVTPIDPWAGIRAAERHHGGLKITRRAALHAATIGGHHVIGAEHEVGALRPGMVADIVAWPVDPLTADLDQATPSPVAVITRGRHRGVT
ncbi:amidohydrolase [Euzebya tangerina]|uniref:amidohydrolase n=1 Tax=Euzebya tangerina TaxID=591198 RepID=UPI000E310ADD|nr:amidohydrolase family protein [Euzebya tangerina]